MTQNPKKTFDDLEDLLEMPAFKYGDMLSQAVNNLEWNGDAFLDFDLVGSVTKVLNWKKEENEKKNNMTPDENYDCKCMGPTESEIDDAIKRFWLAKEKKSNDDEWEEYKPTTTASPELPRKKSDVNDDFPEWNPNPGPPGKPKVIVENKSWDTQDTTETIPAVKKSSLGFTSAREECFRQAAARGTAPPSQISATPRSDNPVRRYMGNRLIKPYVPKPPEVETTKSDGDEKCQDERLKGIDAKLLERVKMDLLVKPSSLTWDDIKGLEFAKETMMEAIVYPLQRPDLFTGLRRPPKGVLMFGPPGTGKTALAKVIANNANATFFNISASSLTSKWVGEGEMMVRALFTYARVHQPSVIFIDEVDSLLSQRSDNEHESSRRLKTEFLVFLDGCGTGDTDNVLIIGATNRPGELDEAARRRFTKRLYIPLPEKEARRDMIQHYLNLVDHTLSEEDVEYLAEATDGFSGADLKVVSETAGYMPMRDIIKRSGGNGLWDIKKEDIPAVTVEHWKTALKGTRPSVSKSALQHYIEWNNTFGTTGGE